MRNENMCNENVNNENVITIMSTEEAYEEENKI
jgi:hypothetical protein